jgi:hypothetical protein
MIGNAGPEMLAAYCCKGNDRWVAIVSPTHEVERRLAEEGVIERLVAFADSSVSNVRDLTPPRDGAALDSNTMRMSYQRQCGR